MPRHSPRLLLPLLLACLPGPAVAQAQKAAPAPDPLMSNEAFLSGHPDLLHRLRGLEAYKAGKHQEAFVHFKRAALYADKPSQGMVAEMLWAGLGTPQDRVLAYIWMDLAAERGYRPFLAPRERYWGELDEAERTHALEEGKAVYAKYGDAAAQPRLDLALRRERLRATGSRTGFVGSVQIFIPGPNGMEQIDGSKFYDPKYWDPRQYRAWHDAVWTSPRQASVTVGAPEKIEGDTPPPPPASGKTDPR